MLRLQVEEVGATKEIGCLGRGRRTGFVDEDDDATGVVANRAKHENYNEIKSKMTGKQNDKMWKRINSFKRDESYRRFKVQVDEVLFSGQWSCSGAATKPGYRVLAGERHGLRTPFLVNCPPNAN